MRTKYNQKGQAYGKIRILDSKYDLRTTKFLKPTQENKEFIQIRNNMFKRMEELHKVIHGKDQGENVFLEYLFNKNDVEVSLSQDKMNKIHKMVDNGKSKKQIEKYIKKKYDCKIDIYW